MYTVKQLARLAGVTPRTLHYYDQIGLLKPSRRMENGYRCYDDQALLRLQQILLYRRLDLPLAAIGAILDRADFDTFTALESHREELRRRVHQLELLIATVDNTLLYLKGIQPMQPASMFKGFSEEQQAEYEQEAMQLYDAEIVKASSQKWKGYTAIEKERILREGGAVYEAFIAAMPAGADSPAARACVERWRKHMDYFWSPNDEQLLALADGYVNDTRFHANFERMQPGLAEFVRQAVKEYLRARRA